MTVWKVMIDSKSIVHTVMPSTYRHADSPKRVYHFDSMSDWEKLLKTHLSSIDDFYSSLSKAKSSEKDYQDATSINKMAKSRHLYVFLMVTSLAALYSDAGFISKSVCIGDSVEVFQNIASPNFKIKISLYKTSAGKEELIAVWFVQNSSKDASIRETYKPKLLFENGTILIRNILVTDEATYMILYEIDGYPVTNKVQIYVLAPPTEPCRLKITHEENFLIASIDNPEYCGNPTASICWMDIPGIYRKSKSILELLPGKEAGTYYACFEGDALMCAKNATDWKKCQYVTIGSIGGNNSPPPSPDIPEIKATSYGIVGIVAIVLFVVIAILSMKLWKRFRKVLKDSEEQNGHQIRPRPPDGQGDGNLETEPLADSRPMGISARSRLGSDETCT